MLQDHDILRIGSAYLRQESNGLSVYDRDMDLYLFFEGAKKSKVQHSPTAASLYGALREQGFSPSTHLCYHYPVRINWMVTGSCNLDCVYCIANNKMEGSVSDRNILHTADHILSLHPLTVALSGGEPTLCPDLFQIIDRIAGKTSLIMDTNGTLTLTDRHIDALRRANAAVRISIDSLSPETVRYLRPCRNRDYDCLTVIETNMHLLLAEHISFGVHSVVTRLNLDELAAVGDWLQEFGVSRWHLYGLLPNGRARDCYSELRVDSEEMDLLRQNLQDRYPGMLITLSPQYNKHEDTPTLMVDSAGRFFVEPVRGMPIYIGEDPLRPTAAEIANCLNVESYVRGYFLDHRSKRADKAGIPLKL